MCIPDNFLLTLAIAVGFLVLPLSSCAQELPANDIVLFSVGTGPQNRPQLSDPVRITDRPAYDNQPAFTPDGTGLLYTAFHEDQTDIMRYDLASGQTVAVLESADSEYSPRMDEEGRYIYAVRVELPDSAQRLWRFSPDGRKGRPAMDAIEPVGYYAWLDPPQIGCFILGEEDRHTLQVGHAGKQKLAVVAVGIGRCLQALPDGSLLFVDQGMKKIRRYDPAARRTQDYASLLPGAQDFVVSPTGEIWMGVGTRLYVYDPAGDQRWHFACDLAETLPQDWGLSSFDRLVLDPSGERVALVFTRVP